MNKEEVDAISADAIPKFNARHFSRFGQVGSTIAWLPASQCSFSKSCSVYVRLFLFSVDLIQND